MARPSKPLISKESAVKASIEIIDAEGIEAFSLPKLAAHMGVRAPSLYHHFADKNEIMTAIARYIAGKSVTRPRRAPGPDWPEYFVSLAVNFRQSVLRHRNAAIVLIQHLPRETLIGSFEDAAKFLSDSGVPSHLHVQILDGIETLCIGAVLAEAARNPRARKRVFPPLDPDKHPHLARAVEANDLSVNELFAQRIRTFLNGIINSDSYRRAEASA
ncbi:bacterial regulatory s, tetR family protein [Mycolicibacterium hassiacum DSM 44199]|jgi:AcrR family transcriptional regulator|uniref:Bacterial regulatory s, tetR family protein n=1 Tax=Mycolicibacterium hassiacum (strain DSM 44199 / CIP 105218 / JCM 12690 / 3849) TaxID=1122247 RepID=K5BBT3_MYCHD|nr:TetR family transcriptional regulator [Mycolicibacterium hassiacum]EKF24540.1 bacterial regulatory s, tetR family protein [Mycolicibacterium hassiacum DSM 44199]MBX5489132.1 TetR/AcrR family transcriptional regulator C-terminal domain-containing protein [Mycolicibacterium hassiacum]MDA4084339.1 TetR family transcriptional regulator [Mycolicibacterium hassiacum DSM 44199]PZN17689.1 MAG: TetR family transcriptional regulator [Mycolicibacterium hassiacum]VCT88981.1 Tetracycline repressor prote